MLYQFRPYVPADRAGCLAILDSNVPRYFVPADRVQLAAFLDMPVGCFDVLDALDGHLLGYGGIAPSRTSAQIAVLTWGIIHADYHRRGLGTFLLEARLDRLAEMPGVAKVVLHTSGAAAGFYRRFGFREVVCTPDGYGPGLDRYEMELPVHT